MTRVPDKVSALLKRLTEELPVALGQNLVGLYVYGSLTQRAFDARRSDIDCIAVTRQGLSQAQFKKLAASLARLSESEPWAARLQITLLSRHEILTRDSKACLYQFGVLKRIRSDGNPIIWMNVLRSGIVLTGPQPRSFVPAITREMLLRALEREVGYLRDEICAKLTSEWRDVPKYRAYAVLTVCRILLSARTGTLVSKPRAARWAMASLSKKWHPTILAALDADAEDGTVHISLPHIARFIDYADAQLRAARNRLSRWQGRSGRCGH